MKGRMATTSDHDGILDVVRLSSEAGTTQVLGAATVSGGARMCPMWPSAKLACRAESTEVAE